MYCICTGRFHLKVPVLSQGLHTIYLRSSPQNRLLQMHVFTQCPEFQIPRVRRALPGFNSGWYEIKKSVTNSYSLITSVRTEAHMLGETGKTELQKKRFIPFVVSLLRHVSTAANCALLGVYKGAGSSWKTLCWRWAGSLDLNSSTQCEEQSSTDLTTWENEAS